ncbi:MAG: topoisomerase DNA-binding C4 zinc finger domain-containing protein, partial [bacterium]
PECKTTRSIPLDYVCPKPECGGRLVVRRSRKGRVFYGCNKYPACTFVTWNAPVKQPCPKCGSTFLTERKLKALRRLICPVEGCGYEVEETTGGPPTDRAAVADGMAAAPATEPEAPPVVVPPVT